MSIFTASASSSVTVAASSLESARLNVRAGSSFLMTWFAMGEPEQHYFYGDSRSVIAILPWDADNVVAHRVLVAASSRLVVSPSSVAVKLAPSLAWDRFVLGVNATGGRDIFVGAATSMGFASGVGEDVGLISASSQSMVFLHAQADLSGVGKFGAPSGIVIESRADAVLETSEEILVPGGDLSNGLLTVLASGVSGEFPFSMAETSSGVVILANGIDPMLRWDGLAAEASEAGVHPPSLPLDMAPSGDGLIIGTRWAYMRFVDTFGNYSNLGPACGPVSMGRSMWISSITVGDDGVPVAASEAHGLSTGDRISIFGVDEMPVVGMYTITVIGDDTFSLGGIVLQPGVTTKPSYWVKGAAVVTYSGCQVPSSPLVARRQVLRNLDGDAQVFYVDVDTGDLTSATLSSTRTDDDLSCQPAVPIRYDDEMPAANRYTVPPSHKADVAYHLGRVFAAVDRPYTIGHCEVSLGSLLVRGVGTNWVPSLAGRAFYVEGSTVLHHVSRVLAPTFLALDRPFEGSSSKFARYSIRPTDMERRLIYYSEASLPEAWPAWNAFAVPEHGDEITGLMLMRSYLYIVERRNISSFTFKADPGKDGFIFLRSNRGCINDRCHVLVEDVCYMLDEAGVHKFDGESSTHLSSRISNLFNDPNYPYRIDWKSPNILLWHGVQDPTTESVRWFIDFVGKPRLTHALCYDYRRERWWLEQYPESVTSSCLATIGYRRVIAGTTARRVIALGEGTLDGIDESVYGSLGGIVSLASDTTMTVVPFEPPMPFNLAGVPITITSGQAKGQVGIVVADLGGGTLEFWKPWAVKPEPGDTFQVGGVNWDWRNGWLPFVDQELDNARDIGVVFKPTATGGSFDVRLYYDYGDAPRPWSLDRSVDGITTIAGSPDINVNTDKVRGYAIQRMQSRRETYSLSDYFLSVEIAGTQGSEPSRVFEVTIDGVFSQARRDQ